MKRESKKVPELRFSGFTETIQIRLIKDLCSNIIDCVNKTAPTVEEETPYRMIRTSNVRNGKIDLSNVKYVTKEVFEKWSKRGKLSFGDLIFTREAPVGEVGLLYDANKVFLGQRTMMYRANPLTCSNFYLLYSLQTRFCKKQIDDFSNGGTVAHMRVPDCGKIKIPIPPLPEQQKIASFLTSVDKKIEQLTKKKALLEQYKKGVMQKIFSQDIRFKDDNGGSFPKWEKKELNHFLEVSGKRNYDNKYNKKNVLSVSGEYGIVNQIELKGRSFAGKLVDNYHVVETGDIVYTKSPLKANPYGIIKVNKGKSGVVSTLYAVYKCRDNIIGEYLDFYFQLDDNLNSYLRPLVQKGAKNDMKISNQKVLIDPITIPSLPEQQKIASFLTSIDKKIKLVDAQIKNTKELKKSLLQKMFI